MLSEMNKLASDKFCQGVSSPVINNYNTGTNI